MASATPRILLTGRPGSGKTTLVRKVLSESEALASGFYTEEVRDNDGIREGFDIVTLDGRRGRLARAGLPWPRVGKYGVDLRFLEEIAIPQLVPDPGVITVVDEIGKMECLSELFIEATRAVLAASSAFLGTVAMGGAPFIREAREHPGVELVEVTRDNRERLVGEITERLKAVSCQPSA